MSAANDLMSLTTLIDNQAPEARIWTIIGDKKPKINWVLLQSLMVCSFFFPVKTMRNYWLAHLPFISKPFIVQVNKSMYHVESLVRAYNGLTRGGKDRSLLYYLFNSLVKRDQAVKDWWNLSVLTGMTSSSPVPSLIFCLATVFINKNTPSKIVKAAIDAVGAGKIKSEQAMNHFCIDEMYGVRIMKFATEMKLTKSQIQLAMIAVCFVHFVQQRGLTCFQLNKYFSEAIHLGLPPNKIDDSIKVSKSIG